VFDLVQIEEQWGSASDDTYRMILGIFAEECAGLCSKALLMLADGRRDQLAHVAHGVRGAAANVGAFRLAECAGLLEAAATHDENALVVLVAEMEYAWDAVRTEIEAGGPMSHGD